MSAPAARRSGTEDPLAAVQAESDPMERARLAGEAIAEYDRRIQVLGRLRAAAIEQAAEQRGMSYSAIAADLGLSRGRVSQIRAQHGLRPRSGRSESARRDEMPLPLEWSG